MLTLVRRSVGRAASAWGAIALLLVTFQFALIRAAESMASQGSYERLVQAVPEFVRSFLGASLGSFAGIVTVGYFEPIPVLMIVLFTVYVATEPAGDVETGLVDLLLSRPLGRHALITRTLAVMLLLPAAIVAAMTTALVVGLWWMASHRSWPHAGHVALLCTYLLAVSWCFGSIGLAVAGRARRRAAAVLPLVVLVIGLYLLETLGAAWNVARMLSLASPFHYFPGADILDGKADVVRDLSILGAVTIAAVLTAYWQFNRRDL